LERLQRELEIDGVIRLGGLDVVVVKDEVDGERSPDLRAGVWHNGEADREVIKPCPGRFFD